MSEYNLIFIISRACWLTTFPSLNCIMLEYNLRHTQRVLADNCMDLATEKNGCVVLQMCAEHRHGEGHKRILAESMH